LLAAYAIEGVPMRGRAAVELNADITLLRFTRGCLPPTDTAGPTCGGSEQVKPLAASAAEAAWRPVQRGSRGVDVGDAAGALSPAGRAVAASGGTLPAVDARRPAEGGNIGRSSVMIGHSRYRLSRAVAGGRPAAGS